jgi:hypothetical protein
LYRAVTYLPPIPLGAAACLVWRHAPALIHASPPNADPATALPARAADRGRAVSAARHRA